MPSYLVPFMTTTLAVVIAATLAAVAFSESIDRDSRRRAVLTLGAIYAVWVPTVVWLAEAEWFGAVVSGGAPVLSPAMARLPLAIALPPLVLVVALALSPDVRRIADGLSQIWLTGLQSLRVVGGVFVLLWGDGAIPWEFALPAGLGDVAVGLIAMVALGKLRSEAPTAAAWVRRTYVFGLADFVLAIGTGFLSSPSAIQLLALDRPNEAIQFYPLTLVLAFAVPVFLSLHILSIRLGAARRAGSGDAAVAA